MFGRLSAGQAMPAWEQVATRRDRIRQAATLMAETVSVIAGATVILLRAVLALAAAVVGMRRRPRRPVPAPGLPRRLPPGLG